MNSAHPLRPAWTPATTLITIFGFILFWPIGLAMLVYIIWGEQWGLDLSDWGSVKSKASEAGEKVKTAFDGSAYSNRTGAGTAGATGNSAFDDWRKAELKRLEEERRKLDEARREFDAYVQELRRARDREEFNQFKSKWENRNTPSQPSSQ